MSKQDSNSNLSLEQLLRLKRTERPDSEFWSNFDRELHQKQLTALVQKRHWWHEITFISTRRLLLPAGAAAVAAITFISVRNSVSTQSLEPIEKPQQIAAIAPLVETLGPVQVASKAVYANPSTYPDSINIASIDSSPTLDKSEKVEPISSVPEIESPSARSIAANLARLEQSEPELIHSVMGSRLSSSARVQTVAASQNDLGDAMAADSASRYRLIARYADRALSPEPSAPLGVRERIARRLGDDLGEGISRIGVVGSRVSLKF